MNSEILPQLIRLGLTLLFSVLVWHYYKGSHFAPSERYSTFVPRFWAGFVDGLVLWPVGFAAAALLTLNIPRPLAAFVVTIESLGWLFYTVVMHARWGQTVGKRITNVRVVDFRTGEGLSWRQSWIREGIPMLLSAGFLGWQVSRILGGSLSPSDLARGAVLPDQKGLWLLAALPGWWFIAEILTMLSNKKRRALHDFIAGTVVIRTNTENRSVDPGAAPDGGPAATLGPSVS